MVKHLPPVLKHLLTLRNPKPFDAPPLRELNAVLSRTHSDACQRGAKNGWLVLSTCTLLTANAPAAVGDLYRFTTRSDLRLPETRIAFASCTDIAAKMREAALKSSIFVGVPRTILSMTSMFEAFEDDVKNALRKETLRKITPSNADQFARRGLALWQSIYEPHAEKLQLKLKSYHPDFMEFIIQAYGAVLAPLAYPPNTAAASASPSPRVQGDLSRTLGSVVGAACLRAEQRVGPQLTSHVFGLLKARNSGDPKESMSEEDQWLSSDEGAEWVVRMVDQIYDVVRGVETRV